MARGNNSMSSAKGQKGHAPKKGGIKTTSKHEFRSNVTGKKKSY